MLSFQQACNKSMPRCFTKATLELKPPEHQGVKLYWSNMMTDSDTEEDDAELCMRELCMKVYCGADGHPRHLTLCWVGSIFMLYPLLLPGFKCKNKKCNQVSSTVSKLSCLE